MLYGIGLDIAEDVQANLDCVFIIYTTWTHVLTKIYQSNTLESLLPLPDPPVNSIPLPPYLPYSSSLWD